MMATKCVDCDHPEFSVNENCQCGCHAPPRRPYCFIVRLSLTNKKRRSDTRSVAVGPDLDFICERAGAYTGGWPVTFMLYDDEGNPLTQSGVELNGGRIVPTIKYRAGKAIRVQASFPPRIDVRRKRPRVDVIFSGWVVSLQSANAVNPQTSTDSPEEP